MVPPTFNLQRRHALKFVEVIGDEDQTLTARMCGDMEIVDTDVSGEHEGDDWIVTLRSQ